MSNQSFLPSLKPGNALGDLHQVGVFDDETDAKLRLDNLSDAILIPAAVQAPGKVANLHSIPNPWARAILFDLALGDVNHLLHDQTVGEWRGVLTLLALKEARGFDPLAVQPINLTNASPFSKILLDLMPVDRSLIDPASTWRQFNLLRWGARHGGVRNSIFAMTSPMTLVATSADYSNVIDKDRVPWFDGTILRDPIASLSKHERKLTAEWILWVEKQIAAPAAKSIRRNIVIQRLQSFAKELDASVQQPQTDSFLSTETKLQLGGIWAPISRPHNGESKLLTELEVVGSWHANLTDATPRYILVDEDAGKDFSKSFKEVVAFRSMSLDTALNKVRDKTDTVLGRDEHKKEFHFCNTDTLFEPVLIYQLYTKKGRDETDGSASSRAFSGCREVRSRQADELIGVREVVLPLSPEITRIYGPEEIMRRFSIEWESEDKAICKLEIEVATVEKAAQNDDPKLPKIPKIVAQRTVTLTKVYNKENMLFQSLLPLIGIWPNFRFENEKKSRWRQYFLFESWNGMKTTEDREGRVTPDEFVVEPLPLRSQFLPRRMITLRGAMENDTFQVSPMDTFPEFLLVKMPSGAKGPRLSDGRKPQGLLVLNPPETPPGNVSHKATLGVDFGTTGTAIYYANAAQPGQTPEAPKQMVFHNRFFLVAWNRGRDEFEKLTRQLFIPHQEWSAGRILSILQDFGSPHKDGVLSKETAKLAVRDSHILFPNLSSSDDASDFFRGAPDSVHSDLKWGSQQQILAARDFLTQICYQSLAELVYTGANAVEIRYSYPTAFSLDDERTFRNNWEVIKRNVKGKPAKKDGIESYPDSITSIQVSFDDVTQNHEAVAATRFFAQTAGLAFGSGALTLDIGGGTTDIALWSLPENEKSPHMMAHLSVLFAGRNLFREPVLQRPEILQIVLDKDPALSILGGSDSARNAKLDALVSVFGDELMFGLASTSGTPPVKAFLDILELGICGLAFYSGLLVGSLIRDGKFKPGSRLPVFVGGNGSKLLRWCDGGGPFNARSPINHRLQASLLAGIKVAAPDIGPLSVVTKLSERPKEEVAYGLVAPVRKITGLELPTPPLEGEDFKISKQPVQVHTWSDNLAAKDLLEFSVLVDEHMGTFKLFLASLDQKSQEFALDDEELRDIAARIDDRLGELADNERIRREKEENASGQVSIRRVPIFFMALKELLAMRIQRWMEIKIEDQK